MERPADNPTPCPSPHSAASDWAGGWIDGERRPGGPQPGRPHAGGTPSSSHAAPGRGGRSQLIETLLRNYHFLSPPPLGSRSPAFCRPGAASRRALRPPLLGARGTPWSARGPGLCGAPAPGSPARPPRSAKARGARRTEGGSESPVSPRAHAPRAPQANTRLSWNYSREGRDGLRPQLPTRDGRGGGPSPPPELRAVGAGSRGAPGARLFGAEREEGSGGHVGARAEPGGARADFVDRAASLGRTSRPESP